MAKLTLKQLKFVTEYIVDLNATQAAIRAGYSKKTARAQGQAMLTKPAIRDEIALLRQKQDAVVLKGREDILLALEQIIFTSPADYCEMGADGLWYLYSGPDLPDNKRMALKGLTSRTVENGAVLSKLECHDKLKAIELYTRMRGWLSSEYTVNVDNRKQNVTLIMPDNGRRRGDTPAATRSTD